MRKIGIIGGGASGLMAALSAAEHGAEVVVFEANDRVGKKILATGNGRCNMTNINAGVNDYHGEQPDFVKGMMDSFWVHETLDFFKKIGVITHVEDNGKVYPYCCTAAAVLDALRLRAEALGIEVVTEFEVKDVIKKKNGFMVISYNNRREKVDRLIVATGGKAAPASGSNGGGYPILEKFGHTVTELRPSLVQIKTEPETVRKLKGIKLNAKVKLGDVSDCGEVLFTDYGLSGPPVFFLSAYLDSEKEISLDIMPEYDLNEIINMLTEKAKNCPNTELESFMSGIINKRVGQILLKSAGISPLSRKASTLDKAEVLKLANLIKAWRFKIEGTMSWNNAQVTKGGIRTKDFDKTTMESKLISGLYATGEILDIDGNCGGYNLQWAWSSGYMAGMSAAVK